MEFYCPNCNTRLSPCETPPFHIGDGLGWGAEVMFVCLNDECPPYVKGWEHIEAAYGHVGSYRYMRLANEEKGELMMVGNQMAFTGSVLDPEVIMAANKRYQQECEWVKQLDTCVADKNLTPVMGILLDEKASLNNKMKASRLLVHLNDISCIDALRNLEYKNGDLEVQRKQAITGILKNNYMKECPDCMEIVKNKAAKCKHCGKDL
ncbi:MAG: zinc ribbon domain-containing protein [Proteobacteria bacterium]|nr:zinc ribbon domain-containing protein [Pseudomonadota bacterium]MBU1640267.1 zinc ribbon domain-containing protein [Pseudomonadota bacterium]